MDSFVLEIAPMFRWLMTTTLHASVIVLIVIGVRGLLSKRIAPRWHYYLWLLVIARMLMPVAPQSALSVFNLFPASTQQTTSTEPEPGTAEIAQTTPAVEPYEINHTPQPPVETVAIEYTPTQYPAATADVHETPTIAIEPIETAAHAEPEITESEPIDYITLLPLGWLIGAVVLALYVLLGNIRLSKIVTQQRPVTDSKILDLLEDCKSQMKLHTYLTVVETSKVSSPALFGFIRPRLLLPEGLLDKLTPAQLRHVFLHELAHLKRGDIYLGWLVALLQTIHWFNPVVWYAFHKMRADRELACDQLALTAIQNEEPNEYGKTIVSLLENFSSPKYNPGLAGILEDRSQLKRRITMIAKHKKGSYRFSTLAAIVIAVLCAVALTSAKDKTPIEEKKASANVFVDLLVNKDFKAAAENFDKTMKKALRPKKLAKKWNETTANAGPFEKKLGTRAEKYLWSDIIYVTCQFKEGPLDVKLVYDKNKQISGLWFVPVPEKVLKEYAKQKNSDEMNSDIDASILKQIVGTWITKTENSRGYGDIRRIDIKDNGNITRYEFDKNQDIRQATIYADRISSLKKHQIAITTGNSRDPGIFTLSLDGNLMIISDSSMSIVFEREETKESSSNVSSNSESEIRIVIKQFWGAIDNQDIQAAQKAYPSFQAKKIKSLKKERDYILREKGVDLDEVKKVIIPENSTEALAISIPIGKQFLWHYLKLKNGQWQILEMDDHRSKHGTQDVLNYCRSQHGQSGEEAAPEETKGSDPFNSSNVLSNSESEIRIVIKQFWGAIDNQDIQAAQKAYPSFQAKKIKSLKEERDYILREKGVDLDEVKKVIIPENSTEALAIYTLGDHFNWHYLRVNDGQWQILDMNVRPSEKDIQAILNYCRSKHGQSGEEAAASEKTKKRYFVTIVAGSDDSRIGYDGEQLGWDELDEMLGNLPNKKNTVLEVAYMPGVIPNLKSFSERTQWFFKNNKAFKRARQFVQELGLEGLSFVGQDNPSSRRGPVSIRTENKLRLDKEIAVELGSFEERPLLNITTAKFSGSHDNLTAKLKYSVTSYPHKHWEIGVRLLDEKGHQIKSVVLNYDNKGIALGVALNYKDEMAFEFGQIDIQTVDRFEVKLREIIKTKETKGSDPFNSHADTSAEAAYIIQKVLNRYAGIKTFSATGERVTVQKRISDKPVDLIKKIAQLITRKPLKDIFTIKMERPWCFLIEWNENYNTGISKIGYAWSVGNGGFVYKHGKHTNYDTSHRGLIYAGDTGKVQSSLFFDTSLNKLRKLRQLSQLADEQVEGVDCFVITGKRLNVSCTYWISKNDFLIRRFRNASGGEGKLDEKKYTISEEQIKESLKRRDKEVTPQAIARIKKQYAEGLEMTAVTRFIRTETYRNIVIDKPIAKESFKPSENTDDIRNKLKKIVAFQDEKEKTSFYLNSSNIDASILKQIVGTWQGRAIDKPEDGSSNDSFKLDIYNSKKGLWARVTGDFVRNGFCHPENLVIDKDTLSFEVDHRTEDLKMKITLRLIGGKLRGEGIPINIEDDRCDIVLTKATALERGLVAHWTLDDDADDSFGTFNAALHGGKFTNGVIGQGCEFNGSSDFIKIDSHKSLDLRESLTLSAWVKNNDDKDGGQIIWRGDTRGASDPYELHIFGGKMEFRIDADSGGDSYTVQSKENVDNNWHLWTGVYDKSNGKLYLYKDAQLENTAVITEDINYDTSTCWNVIGAVENGTWQNFKGTIDDARIYNRPLNANEVKQLYGNPKIPVEKTKGSDPFSSNVKNFPYIARPVSGNVSIRSGGGSAYYTCGKLKTDVDVTVVGEEFGWAKIIPPKGSFSWIAKKYIDIDPSNPKVGIVNTDKVRVWVGSPGYDALHSSVTQIKLSKKNSDVVELLGVEDSAYLKIAPPSGGYLYVPAKELKYIASVSAIADKVKSDPKVKPEKTNAIKGYLPDLESKGVDVVLDLASGKMLSARGLDKDRHYFDKLGKGDIAYEYASGKGALLCLRGAVMQGVEPDIKRSYFNGYFIKQTPCQYQLTTADGQKYDIKVLSVEKGDKGGAKIEFRKSDNKKALLPSDMFKVLDLSAGKVVDIPKTMEDETKLRQYVERNYSAAVIFDHDGEMSHLAFVNASNIDRATKIKNGFKIMSFVSKNVPQDIIITAKDQKKYHLRITKAEHKGAHLEYQTIKENPTAPNLQIAAQTSLQDYLGTWEMVDVKGKDASKFKTAEITFNTDGTCVAESTENNGENNNSKMKYVFKDSKIIVDGHKDINIYLENGRLIFIEDDSRFTFKKKIQNTKTAKHTLQDYLGTWEMTEATGKDASDIKALTITFQPAGNAIVEATDAKGSLDIDKMSYVFKDGKIKIGDGSDVDVFFENGKLICIADDTKYTFKKKNSTYKKQSLQNYLGTWEMTEAVGSNDSGLKSITITFNSNRTAVIKLTKANGSVDTDKMSYVFKDGQLSLEDGGDGFFIENGKLICTDSGTKYIFEKKVQKNTKIAKHTLRDYLGIWKMTEATGKGASEIKAITITFQPGGTAVIDFSPIKGSPETNKESYVFKNGKMTFGDDDVDDISLENDSLIIFADDSKFTFKKISSENTETSKPSKSKASHIPSTSIINKNGHIEDKVDYPFVNDPSVIGKWVSVDFVSEISQFKPAKKRWNGDLFLAAKIFHKGGKVEGILNKENGQITCTDKWTKGLVMDKDTASKYIIKKIDGSEYMFFEWKSGDYRFRHSKPSYYVLKKATDESN